MFRAAGTLVLCGALALGASSPVQAAPAPTPKVQLKIVDSVKGGATKTVWLHCGPVGGDHPNARAACRLLQRVDGDPAKLNVTPDATCTKELQPHVAAVVGRWHGKVVRWAKVFPNGCLMKAAAGKVLAL
ncbi:proteinase inhibitor I4 serpin [Nonomuraea sp. K274]|uniref:Proteinase inhibitor I4 serpin n=1 Tax=Nonomuraea cypriaca TaxID=1187855 RepID=A0A931F1G7_9ACTN|nr:SSI family serine proteinase inhibitor [Nonomuraea cypriaca]MBF8190475.1 proteinase inhibitor I4 serpin [Nonomuraea cypriaca]